MNWSRSRHAEIFCKNTHVTNFICNLSYSTIWTYLNNMRFLSVNFSISTPWSSRSLTSPGKREFKATVGPGMVCYWKIHLFERIWMVKTTSCLKSLAETLCGISILAYLKTCFFADTTAVRLTEGLNNRNNLYFITNYHNDIDFLNSLKFFEKPKTALLKSCFFLLSNST